MNCPINDRCARFVLSRAYQVDFTAYAPFHTFKGWTAKGVEGLIEIDFSSQTIVRARAEALTACFDTGDPERNRAMADYMQVTTYPRASIEMKECRELVRLDDTRFRAAVTAELNFIGKRQHLPLTFYINMSQASFEVEMDFRWSFKDHGLKAPSLLFLKVRDHVDIRGKGVFVPGPADDGPAS